MSMPTCEVPCTVAVVAGRVPRGSALKYEAALVAVAAAPVCVSL